MSLLLDVATLAETLKALEHTFALKDQAIAETHSLLLHCYCDAMYDIVYPLRQKLQARQRGQSTKIDTYQVPNTV
jgi:hypothetical protein